MADKTFQPDNQFVIRLGLFGIGVILLIVAIINHPAKVPQSSTQLLPPASNAELKVEPASPGTGSNPQPGTATPQTPGTSTQSGQPNLQPAQQSGDMTPEMKQELGL